MSEEKAKKLSVVKVTLSSGKTVLLHEMKISHTQKAGKLVANEAGESQSLFGMLMQKAILQQIIYKIDDKVVTMAERDDFDKLLTVAEYGQLSKVVAKISGGDESKGEAKVELVAE